jgi:hypothetical protein
MFTVRFEHAIKELDMWKAALQILETSENRGYTRPQP